MKSYRTTSFFYLVIGLVALALFGTLSFGINGSVSWIEALDYKGTTFLEVSETSTLTTLIKNATEVGNIRLIIGLTIVMCGILFLKKYYSAGLWLGGTILFGAAVITKLLKEFFARERPQVQQIIEKTTESFPSGHATGTTVFFLTLIIASLLFLRKGTLRTIFVWLFSFIIAFVLLSRIYLGVHYPTDVIGGFLLGTASTCISVGLYLKLEQPLSNLLKKMKLNNKSLEIQTERKKYHYL